MNTSRSFAVPVLAAFAFLFASVMPARAQFGALEGETFETIEVGKNTATCDPGGLIRYFVEGTAVGPQPGTFEETGEIKFDSASGQILGLAISFTISVGSPKPIVTVTGQKFLTEGTANCAVDKLTGFAAFTARAVLSYDANISGTFDKGDAVLDLIGSIDSRGLLGLTLRTLIRA